MVGRSAGGGEGQGVRSNPQHLRGHRGTGAVEGRNAALSTEGQDDRAAQDQFRRTGSLGESHQCSLRGLLPLYWVALAATGNTQRTADTRNAQVGLEESAGGTRRLRKER